jgi:DNA polymerase-3 subunit delta'
MVEQALAGLPRINWRLVHRIADGIAGREGETQYEAFLRAIFAFLSTSLRRRRDASPSQLAPYAEAWEKLERDARDLQIFNLDKRAFALGVFSALAEAQRAANPGSQQN